MILRFLAKYFKTLTDILIVAAIVGAFAYFDPFGWFRGPTKIKDTPLILSSVRSIGQLVTAEYYGEAVATLADTIFEDYTPSTVNREAERTYKAILDSVNIMRAEKPKHWWEADENQRNIFTKLTDRFPDLAENPFFEKVLLHYARYNMLQPKENDLKIILWHIHEYRQPALKSPEQFATATFPISENGKKLKNQLVYIGRGTVRAGINLGRFTESNFWYNSTTHKICLANIEPEILDYDINPWFIPEKGVKGYELVKITGKLKSDPLPAAARVKLRCKENLRAQAIEVGIISQAKENARQSLKELFSMLLDEPVEDVVFMENKYDQMNSFLVDSIISPIEAKALLSIVTKDFSQVDTLWYDNPQDQIRDLMDFCQKMARIQTPIKGLLANRLGLEACATLTDEVMEAKEKAHLDSLVIKYNTNKCNEQRRWLNIFTSKRMSYDSLSTLKKSGCWPSFVKDNTTAQQWAAIVSKKIKNRRVEAANKSFWIGYRNQVDVDAIWFKTNKEWQASVVQFQQALK